MTPIGASNFVGHGNRLGLLIVPGRQYENLKTRSHLQQTQFDLKFPSKAAELRMKPASAPIFLTSGANNRLHALLSLRALGALILVVKMLVILVLTPLRRKFGSPILVRVPAVVATRRNGSSRDAGVAVRRAMAIKRVVESLGTGKSKRDFSLFVTSRGDTLFTRSWTPINAPIKGLVLILHGLNEHSGRYDSFARRLNEGGFKVYAMDWTGHGGSDGLHGYVHSLDYAVADTKSFLGKMQEENRGLPCFCFGHSTGGAIILKAALDTDVAARLRGVILSSPAIRVQPTHPVLAMVAPIVSLLMPRYQLRATDKKDSAVSRDPTALEAKYSDPLVFTGALRVRTGYEILRITAFLQENLGRVSVPFLALHGSADTVTEPAATSQLHEAACSEDKSLKIYDGLLHDLLFEPEGEEVAEDIVAWMEARVD